VASIIPAFSDVSYNYAIETNSIVIEIFISEARMCIKSSFKRRG
jgi:hypothetical protein